MTWTVAGYLVPVAAVVVGAVWALRSRSGTHGVMIIGLSVAAAVVVGWIAWLAGTSV